jgi:hypothetical protein
MKTLMWAVCLLGLTAVGCVTGSTTSGSAVLHSRFPYAVTYDDAEKRSVLGDEWRLENYRRIEGSTDIERKEGYSLKYELDFDDDDKTDSTAELPFPDLLLVNKRTNARLEVSTLLLDQRTSSKELRVLLQDLVDSRSGTRSLLFGFEHGVVGVGKRYATRLVDSAEATLGGQKGLVATIERADLDQLQLDPKARWQRSRLFMMHAPFDYVVPLGVPSESAEPWSLAATPNTKPPTTAKGRVISYRVLLVVEYTNTPEDYEAQYPEFLRLLNKTHMLTDEMLIAYLGEPLSRCQQHVEKARVELSIGTSGKASVRSVTGVEQECAYQVFEPFHFAGGPEPRVLSSEFDFTKPQKPSWLTEGAYLEQRQQLPAATAPASSDAPAPAPAPAPTEPPPPAAEPAAPTTTTAPPSPGPAPEPGSEAPAPTGR